MIVYSVLCQGNTARNHSSIIAKKERHRTLFSPLQINPTCTRHLLLGGGLGGALGNLSGRAIHLLNLLDDTDSNGLTHITDGEATKGCVLSEFLHAKGLLRNHLNEGGVTALDELGSLLHGLVGTTINLSLKLTELAGNVGSVAIDDGGVTGADLTRVVQDDDLSNEGTGLLGGIILGVRGDEATADILHRDVLDVETNVVTGSTLRHGLVVHFHRLDFSRHTSRGKVDNHTGLDHTSLNTTDGDGTNTTDLVDVLERQTQGLVHGASGRLNGVDGLNKGLDDLVATSAGNLASLPPGHVGGTLDHVITEPSGEGDHGNLLRLVADLAQELLDLRADFLVTSLAPLANVHLVDGNNELLDTKSVGEQGVLTGLTLLADTGLELTGGRGDGQNSTVSLAGTSDHVLDEITMARGVDDGDVELGGLELGEGSINGDTTLTLSLQVVQNPGVLEGTLTHLVGLLLILFNGTLVDTTALVDEMASGGGLARVDVSDDDNVDVSLLPTHFGCSS